MIANDKTTHDFLDKAIKPLLHFLVPSQTSLTPKIRRIQNLAKKVKKLGSRQETVLAGVAEHFTEEEKSNINLTLSKIDQISNNLKVEKNTPSHQNTTEKPNFEAFFISFKHELRAYEESDTMDCLMFYTAE